MKYDEFRVKWARAPMAVGRFGFGASLLLFYEER
jgi:hypothetical protein